LVVPALSILLALGVASILIIASGLVGPDKQLDLRLPFIAYGALLQGAFGSLRGIANTIVQAAPLILTGLSVGVGLKAGLFNIGATGQVLLGGFIAALLGAKLAGAPIWIAIPVALLGGILAGALAGFIPGALKAYTGAHEVVTTIMLNALIRYTVSGLVNDVFRDPGPTFARTADTGHATLIGLGGTTFHYGVILAFLCIPLSYWFLWRTTTGFEIRSVGANPTAARYAGMNPRRMIILTMSLCGAFAGLAGAIDILRQGNYPATYGTSIGWDGITVALLGQGHPVGIMLSALLLGAMQAGAGLMAIQADVPAEIIDVIQGLILLFLAAEVVIRRLLRVRAETVTPDELSTVSASYGQGSAT
jgi:simple sugar transport system permease protein